MASTLVRQLLDAGVHFGHQTKRWHPKMKRYIFGSRAGIYIIDLEQTEQRLTAAGDFLEDLAAKGQQIVFIGTKKQARAILQAEAARCGMPYVVTRWLGGTLTNYQTIKRNIERMRELRTQRAEGYFDRLSKKDAKQLTRQLERLEEGFAGLADLERLPGALIVVDTKREQIAVREANRVEIPIVAICDTNADPDLVTHPIPGNDDAIRSIRLITSLLADRILAGRERYLALQPVAKPEAAASNGEAAAEAVEPQAGSAPAEEAPEATA